MAMHSKNTSTGRRPAKAKKPKKPARKPARKPAKKPAKKSPPRPAPEPKPEPTKAPEKPADPVAKEEKPKASTQGKLREDPRWYELDKMEPPKDLARILNDIRIYLRQPLQVAKADAPMVEVKVTERAGDLLFDWMLLGGARPFGIVERREGRFFICAPFRAKGEVVFGRVIDDGEELQINRWKGATFKV